MLKTLARDAQKHIIHYLPIYLVFVGLFFLGLILGLLRFFSLDAVADPSYGQLIQGLLSGRAYGFAECFDQSAEAFAFNGLLLAVLFLSGLTLFAPLIVLPLFFYKAYSLGFALSCLMLAGAGKGFLLSLIVILPQALISVPLFFVAAFYPLRFSYLLLQGLRGSFASYLFCFVVLLTALVLAAFLQGYLSPLLLQLCFAA